MFNDGILKKVFGKDEKRLQKTAETIIIELHLPVWWNWQTRWTQNPVVVIPYRFDPDHRHHGRGRQFCRPRPILHPCKKRHRLFTVIPSVAEESPRSLQESVNIIRNVSSLA